MHELSAMTLWCGIRMCGARVVRGVGGGLGHLCLLLRPARLDGEAAPVRQPFDAAGRPPCKMNPHIPGMTYREG